MGETELVEEVRGAQLYRHYDAAGALLYVGISINMMLRLAQHRLESSWFDKIASVKVQHFATRQEALLAEKQAVREERPIYNIRLVERPAESVAQGRIEQSRKAILGRLVSYHPVYTIDEAANEISVSRKVIRAAMMCGDLGFIEVPTPRGGKKAQLRITGWQLLDYIEVLQARSNSRKAS